jgi:hypothetical protein
VQVFIFAYKTLEDTKENALAEQGAQKGGQTFTKRILGVCGPWRQGSFYGIRQKDGELAGLKPDFWRCPGSRQNHRRRTLERKTALES